MSSKLREALSKASIALSWATHHHLTEDDAKECLAIVDAALDEPPRNYEVGTIEEQRERFILFCRRNSFRGVCSSGCKFANVVNQQSGWQRIGQAGCFPFWAQMPYEEVKR
jgi:hypothetical protein